MDEDQTRGNAQQDEMSSDRTVRSVSVLSFINSTNPTYPELLPVVDAAAA